MTQDRKVYVLTVECPDRPGIVAKTSTFLYEAGASIDEAAQFGDPDTQRFFARVVFSFGGEHDLDAIREGMAAVAAPFDMIWTVSPTDVPMKLLIAVSRFGHCLNDLLHRWRAGSLPVDIAAVISNHDDMRSLVEWHGIPYHHLPVTKSTKAAQEQKLLALVDSLDIDLVVLARYMQILTPATCAALSRKCINIHHSFLPSFKGARPYHAAHDKGVKLIGATAHYVTSDLDEGPIIEQDVKRVSHAHTPHKMVEIGRDIESVVLARAVRWHAERRVFIDENKTVVFTP